MVKMKIHSELDDSKISKLNEFFLVADRIRKAGRSSRQGFGKFKNKLNPNGGGVRLSVSISSGISPLTNGLLSLATPSVQSSREAPPRHEAQALTTHQGGAISKLPRNQSSAPVSGKDPYNIRSGSPSPDLERRSTLAAAPKSRSAIVPMTSPSRAKEGAQADGKKPPEGATTPRNSIFFDLPRPKDPKAQITEASINLFASPRDRNQEGDA
jgi:hypothetical protein